uniref:FIIND domain-containing protein n=1 Tax=Rhinopithecus roxellana TaxID=61622 RepID=A0A2K6QLA6_RHIRO
MTENILVPFLVWIQRSRTAYSAHSLFLFDICIPTASESFRPCLFQLFTSYMSSIFFSGDICSEENQIVSSYAAKLGFEVEQDYTNHQFLGPEGNVDVELIDKSTNTYSLRFPTAGWYLWSATGLGFVVRDAVTVTIAFGSWSQHLGLDLQHHEQWLVAGPLFAITAEPEEAVAEIHLPHFISLQAGEVDVSWFLMAHFKDEGMVLEQPSRVEPFYAVLENPSFSLMGILLRIARGTRLSIPITSNTLLYFHPHPEDVKFHLYLVPSDALLTKVS